MQLLNEGKRRRNKPFTTVAVVLFAMIAFVHLLRLFLDWEVTVTGMVVPKWVSVPGVDKFVEVRFEDKKQILGSKLVPRIPHLLCILVLATEYGKDRFFILEWEQLQDIAVSGYSAWLAAKDGVRPRNYKCLHCSVSPVQLAEFENQWSRITARL